MPRSLDFSSARLKVERANEHITQLYREWQSFVSSDPYLTIEECEIDTRDHVFYIEPIEIPRSDLDC